ncbi:MAG TPA: hypothetical protein VF102_02050 [Gemmatimonadaceae bacterium]|jgi:hypothetical protein
MSGDARWTIGASSGVAGRTMSSAFFPTNARIQWSGTWGDREGAIDQAVGDAPRNACIIMWSRIPAPPSPVRLSGGRSGAVRDP